MVRAVKRAAAMTSPDLKLQTEIADMIEQGSASPMRKAERIMELVRAHDDAHAECFRKRFESALSASGQFAPLLIEHDDEAAIGHWLVPSNAGDHPDMPGPCVEGGMR